MHDCISETGTFGNLTKSKQIKVQIIAGYLPNLVANKLSPVGPWNTTISTVMGGSDATTTLLPSLDMFDEALLSLSVQDQYILFPFRVDGGPHKLPQHGYRVKTYGFDLHTKETAIWDEIQNITTSQHRHALERASHISCHALTLTTRITYTYITPTPCKRNTSLTNPSVCHV